MARRGGVCLGRQHRHVQLWASIKSQGEGAREGAGRRYGMQQARVSSISMLQLVVSGAEGAAVMLRMLTTPHARRLQWREPAKEEEGRCEQ